MARPRTQILAAAERLGHALRTRIAIIPRWGELQLRCEDDKGSFQAFQLSADPTGVDMDRVAAAMRVVGDVEAGRVTPDSAARVIDRISTAPPSPTWLFTLAAAAGAVALAVIFGVSHVAAAAFILVSAGAG
jgi:uncharacterized membrane protein YjjP (DUF1212 family)